MHSPGLNKPSSYALFFLLLTPLISNADNLKVFTSADPDSNARQSFIIVPDDAIIPEGIKHDSQQTLLARQVPFIIELLEPAAAEYDIQWSVKALNKHHQGIRIFSAYHNSSSTFSKSQWQSNVLDATVNDRNKLIFSPRSIKHKSAMYKKGRGSNNKRRKYGGGSLLINNSGFNPRIGYEVSVDIIKNNAIFNTYKTRIQMDKKDMIRQEYINHFNIKRYGYGKNGNLPVPRRDEITGLPILKNIHGNPLTESRYHLIINDGIQNIASLVATLYQFQLDAYKKDNSLINLAGKKLNIPANTLWLSGGWRNPERNEWYSNAVNGIHQRGGAVDFVIKGPPGHINTAISYWVLWNALQNNRHRLDAFWQLETNGRPMRTNEFIEDIEPKNGIPDAFDKADHLHVNVLYNENT